MASDRRRLLIVGLNYAPEPVGIGPYTAGLAEALVARGWQVSVIAGEPYYPQWHRLADQPRGWSTRMENGVRVTRCPHYIPARPSGSRRLVHHATFALAAFFPALVAALRDRPDYVLTVAPSLVSVPVGLLAARLCGAQSWIHVQDFEVEAAFATGLLRDGSGVGRFARKVEARLLRAADLVTTISPQMIARLARHGISPPRTHELRNWANHGTALANSDGAHFRREWNLEGKRVALYSGNIANKQGLEIVLDVARLLRERDDIAFVICGNGPNRARMEALAADLPNVQFHDLQPAERVGDLLAMADIHLLPQLAAAADLVLPSKLTNMLASGRPVIATASAGTGLAAEVEGCGLVVPPGNAEAFAAAIVRLVDDPETARTFGEAGARRASERWSREAIIDRLDARLQGRMPA